MKRAPVIVVYLLLVALLPVFLAVNQDVPAGSAYKQVVLLVSLAAFGLLLGQFWLSRLWPTSMVNIRPAAVLRWHKIFGYCACGFLLIHPVLMIARRFWVQESDPVDNLLLMLRAPALVPAIVAWCGLALLTILSLLRRSFRPRTWRIVHGFLSAGFAAMATWHVVAVGRHANTLMSAFWIVLAAGSIGALLHSYVRQHSPRTIEIHQGVSHESAR